MARGADFCPSMYMEAVRQQERIAHVRRTGTRDAVRTGGEQGQNSPATHTETCSRPQGRHAIAIPNSSRFEQALICCAVRLAAFEDRICHREKVAAVALCQDLPAIFAPVQSRSVLQPAPFALVLVQSVDPSRSPSLCISSGELFSVGHLSRRRRLNPTPGFLSRRAARNSLLVVQPRECHSTSR